jgi:hypothetical protein|tara:strand:- start:1012 stop:1185 length:174 start_codon:yes stop_codon:yes gene_type:complete
MQPGDLVRHKTITSYGVGLVTHVAVGTKALKVLWSVNKSKVPTAEICDMLEVVSEVE